jgi:flagellar motor protein MotB
MLKDKKSILSHSDSTPLYSGTIWVTTLADLYLVLLVFFIMLNNISSADKIREKKAVESINQSFSKTDHISYDNNAEILDFPTIAANYLDNMEGLLNGAFKSEGVKINRSGNKMVAEIPADNFFEQGQVVIKDKHRKFFKSLSDIMLKKTNDIKIGTEITIDSKALRDSGVNGDYKIDVDRAKILADKFMSSGFMGGDVSSGISFGSSDNIVMQFTVMDTVAQIGN